MLRMVRNANSVLRKWDKAGYVILIPHLKGSYAHFNLHNMNIYMYLRDIRCDKPYRFTGENFSALRRLALRKTSLGTFEYTNGFLHNAEIMIRCQELTSMDVPKNITESIPYKHIGTWYNHINYRLFEPFIGEDEYAYVYFMENSIFTGSRTFLMLYEENGIKKDYAKTEGQLALHKEALLFLPQDTYDIYVYKHKYYFINPKKTIYFIVTPTANKPHQVELPPLEQYSYMELSKDFREVKKQIFRRLNLYLNIYFTEKKLIIKSSDGSKYLATVSQYRGKFPKHVEILAPMLALFSPGYFYFTYNKTPNILVKYDPWHKIWYGTILTKIE